MQKPVTREHIEESKLSEQQRNILQQVCEANLKAAFDEVLRQRGIPLTVYGFQLAVTSKKEKSEGENGGNGPEPNGMPPPGGCYCCFGNPPNAPAASTTLVN